MFKEHKSYQSKYLIVSINFETPSYISFKMCMYVEYTKSGKLVKQVKVFVSLELNCQSDVSYNFDIL